jgi:hypothetical protein
MLTDFQKKSQMEEASREIDRRAQALVKGGRAANYSEAVQAVVREDYRLARQYGGDSPAGAKVERVRRDRSYRLNIQQQVVLDRVHQKNLAELRGLYPAYTDTQLAQMLLAEDGKAARVYKCLMGVAHQDDLDFFSREYGMPKE